MVMIKRIGDLRVDNDLTQKQMADILGISRSKYSKIEVGILDVDLDTLNKFANYFEINIDYIYGLTNNKIKTYGKDINIKEIGNNIKSIRTNLGLSQQDICIYTKFKQSSYSRYEAGIGLTGYKLYIFAKSLNLSMDNLMNRKVLINN